MPLFFNRAPFCKLCLLAFDATGTGVAVQCVSRLNRSSLGRSAIWAPQAASSGWGDSPMALPKAFCPDQANCNPSRDGLQMPCDVAGATRTSRQQLQSVLLGCYSSFLVRLERRFSVPACTTRVRRARRRSRLAAGHRRRRREAVLTVASTARGLIRLEATCPAGSWSRPVWSRAPRASAVQEAAQQHRRAASWMARERRYARRVGRMHFISGHTGHLQPFIKRLTAGRKSHLHTERSLRNPGVGRRPLTAPCIQSPHSAV